MKECNICKETKPFNRFSKHPTAYGGVGAKCKSCVNEYNRNYRSNHLNKVKAKAYKKNRYDKERHPLNYTAVYYLPEEHYVGITLNVKSRMHQHKNVGKIIDNYEILAYFERSVDAHYFETLLHMRNYNGYFNGTGN